MFYSSFLRIFFVFNVLGGLSFAAQQYAQQQPAQQQQPRYAQPAQQQPAQQQPRYAQPAQQQPAQQQPRYAQPAQQQPAQQQPRYAQPAQQQPAQQQPRYAQPAQQPAQQQPRYAQPAQQPAQQQPRYAQPAQQQPAQQQPRYAQPAQQQPAQQQPRYAQPAQQQPVAQPQPAQQQPVAQQPSSTKKKASEPSSKDLFTGLKASAEFGYTMFPSLMGGTADPLNGMLGGLDIGYGYTFSHSFYVGGKGFLHYGLSEVTQTIPIIGKVTESAHLSYGAALQAGYVINNVLPYVELGYSMQQVEQTIGIVPAISNSIKGPLLGAGIDYVFTSFFIGAEANMMLYSNSTSASSKSTSSKSTNVINVLLKLGFIF